MYKMSRRKIYLRRSDSRKLKNSGHMRLILIFLIVQKKYNGSHLPCLRGDSDVGDFMMATDLRCWRQNHYVGDFFRYVGDFLYVLNRSPTS